VLGKKDNRVGETEREGRKNPRERQKLEETKNARTVQAGKTKIRGPPRQGGGLQNVKEKGQIAAEQQEGGGVCIGATCPAKKGKGEEITRQSEKAKKKGPS